MVETTEHTADLTESTNEPQLLLKKKVKPVQVSTDTRQDDPAVQKPTEKMTGERCEECRKQGCFVHNRKEGSIVCTNCGLVQKSRVIDETSEWRNFGDEGKSTADRVGGRLNPFLTDFGLSTVANGTRELKMWSERT